jgi:hypothetical protein
LHFAYRWEEAEIPQTIFASTQIITTSWFISGAFIAAQRTLSTQVSIGMFIGIASNWSIRLSGRSSFLEIPPTMEL